MMGLSKNSSASRESRRAANRGLMILAEIEVLEDQLVKSRNKISKLPVMKKFFRMERRFTHLLSKAAQEAKVVLNERFGKGAHTHLDLDTDDPVEIAARLGGLFGGQPKEEKLWKGEKKSDKIEVENADLSGFKCTFNQLRDELKRRGKDNEDIDEMLLVLMNTTSRFSSFVRNYLSEIKPCLEHGHSHPEMMEAIVLGLGMWFGVNNASGVFTEKQTEEFLQIAKLIVVERLNSNVPASKGSA